MGISHSWNGTVLTITSDSGTSSADLKGDTGIRGPQGPAGGFSPSIDLAEQETGVEITVNNVDGATTTTINHGIATDEQVINTINNWFDEHPEATTTVKDGSITEEKLSADILEKINNGGNLSEETETRLNDLEEEVFTVETITETETTPGIDPSVKLVWMEGCAYSIGKGVLSDNAQYNSTEFFPTTEFPEITNPDLLTETAGSLVSFKNGDTYVGYWTAGEYHNSGMAVIEKPTFTQAAFSIRSATDYTQIELVYAETTTTTKTEKVPKISDLRERTTVLEGRMTTLETKVKNLEETGVSSGDISGGSTFVGKKYYLFGDSITYWDSRISWYDDTVYMVAYPSYIRDVLLADIVNCGVAGNTSASITTRLKNTDLTDAYAVTYMSGANDLNQNVAIGTIGEFDTTTYIGNIETAIKYVAENYPNVKFYLLAPLYITKGDIKPYAEAMAQVAEYYSIPILRWDNVSQINQFNHSYYMVDGVHPNNIGHQVMADTLIPFLKNN